MSDSSKWRLGSRLPDVRNRPRAEKLFQVEINDALIEAVGAFRYKLDNAVRVYLERTIADPAQLPVHQDRKAQQHLLEPTDKVRDDCVCNCGKCAINDDGHADVVISGPANFFGQKLS